MKKLNEITIADLMPDSISGDAQVSATARAIDPQLRLISEAVDRPLILAAIDDLSAGVLEHLAVQYDVTSWDSAWPIETKRAVLKTAIADKRKKGTRGAVERAIEAVAPIATITEWWQDPDGEMPPHTFKIDLLQEESAVDAETQANVIAQVNEAKPVRSHYTFTAIQQAGSGLYFAGVLRAISYARVRSAGISIERTSIQAGVLATLRGMSIRRLLASSHMGEMPEPRTMGICGVLTATSDEVVEVETPYQLENGTISFTGELRDNVIPPSGVVKEWVNNTIELDLGFSYSQGWRADDLYSGNPPLLMPISQTDADSLTSFGVQLQTYGSAYEGLFGHIGNGNTSFNYEVVCLYTDLNSDGGSNPISVVSSDFSVIAHSWPWTDGMYLTCTGRYNGVKGCRIKITKPEQ